MWPLTAFLLVGMASAEQCWCFPEEVAFYEQYRQEMHSYEDYYVEATFTLMNSILANKTIVSYSGISSHVAEIQSQCYDSPVLDRMMFLIDAENIQKALDKIVKPCPCY